MEGEELGLMTAMRIDLGILITNTTGVEDYQAQKQIAYRR